MIDNSFIIEILEKRRMLNIEEEMNIYHLLTQAILLKIPGDIVELGCNDGRTSAIMQKTLDEYKSKKIIYAYDSFEGLPQKNKKDGDTEFKEGWCMKPKQDLINVFKKYELKLPKIVPGWFKDTLLKKLPKKISFAHLDGDFYSSIKESLEAIYPRLSKGAIVVIDDYGIPKIHKKIEKLINNNSYSKLSNRKIKINNDLSGVKRACDEFFKNKKEEIKILIAGEEKQTYFRKL
jgi:O-methyltransferase